MTKTDGLITCAWCGWADVLAAPRDLVLRDDGLWECRDEPYCSMITMVMLESDAFTPEETVDG
jgi:hypothetical protein